MSLGQFAASTQFYIVGKATCTKTGWEKAIQKYKKPDILADPRLSVAGHVYMVTGANAGIGKEIATQLARRGATVYMVCRNLAKAEKARDEISHIAKSSSVHVLQCDCSLESDVRNLWENFKCSQNGGKSCSIPNDKVRLDGLVCNAGAILSEKIFTSEGVEVSPQNSNVPHLFMTLKIFIFIVLLLPRPPLPRISYTGPIFLALWQWNLWKRLRALE
jgi:dehydrogenase/reductase SDR family member 12